MKTSTGKFHKYIGLSLIEIMVAMAIGMLLMTGTASMFISNKRIYKEQDEMGRLQENARFAMQILIEDIRMAGHAGCANDIDEIQNHVDGMTDDDMLMSFVNAVEGLENRANGDVWEPSDSTDQVTSMVDDTDAFSIRFLQPSGIDIFFRHAK